MHSVFVIFKMYFMFYYNWLFLDRKLIDITNVCMDETAVSSDPVIAFLLDEVVVKDWVKRTFKSILAELQEICILLDV